MSGYDVDHLPYGAVLPLGGFTAEDQATAAIPDRLGQRPVLATRLHGDAVLLPLLAASGFLGDDEALHKALMAPSLNALIELGPAAWQDLRSRLQDVLPDAADRSAARVPLGRAAHVLPVRVTDYVDFYASLEHATNFGRIFRPGQPPLPDNWRHLPVGYHGRASTVQVSGLPVRRPRGMVAPDEVVETAALDVECEVGYVCGPTTRGPIAIDDANQHLFGVVLVNDWSARDIQRFEYVPLGPFLGKSFATSMSAWVTPLAALRDARADPRPQDPPPPAHLRATTPWGLDLELEIELNGEVVSRPNARGLYWTPPQMLTHLTSNGATLSAGDLFATGTVSGEEPGTEGSLAEVYGGERWLADGDEVVLRGRAGSIELGEVRGVVTA
jgi:fumarylacetoacetase